MNKIAIAVTLFAASTAAFAGGGAGGQATEVSQLANHEELISSVAEEANLNATALQQFVVQAGQLGTMKQNLLKMPEALISQALGDRSAQLMPFVRAMKDSTALAASANAASDLLAVDTKTMQFLHMNPSTYFQTRARMSAQGATDIAQQQSNLQQSLADLQSKSQAVNDLAAANPQISGSVQGFQTLATQNAQLSHILLEQSADLKRLIALEQDRAARENTSVGAGAAVADGYAAARQAEHDSYAAGVAAAQAAQAKGGKQ